MKIIEQILRRCMLNCPRTYKEIIYYLTQVSTIIGIWSFVFGLFISYVLHNPIMEPFVYPSIIELAQQSPLIPVHLYVNITIMLSSIMIVIPKPSWGITFIGTIPSAYFVTLFIYYTLSQRIEPAPFFVYVVCIAWVLLQWVLVINVADGKLR